jgi:heme/copper-type cytochrome/quinol oxidase subunit 2
VTVRFVADKAGTFEIACSEYCGKGHKKMKGQLVVKEAAK